MIDVLPWLLGVGCAVVFVGVMGLNVLAFYVAWQMFKEMLQKVK